MSMSLTMLVHSAIGTAVVITGAIALLSAKGSHLHRRCGTGFTTLMGIMGIVVITGAWSQPKTISSLGILFSVYMCYLVATAWLTINRSQSKITMLDYLAPAVALGICLAALSLGVDAVTNPVNEPNPPPVEAYFVFAILSFLSMLFDINHIKLQGVRGKHRIIRHVWRMSCALFFSTSSLFTGPGSVVFPETLRHQTLLAGPQTLVILITVFWLYRLLRGL